MAHPCTRCHKSTYMSLLIEDFYQNVNWYPTDDGLLEVIVMMIYSSVEFNFSSICPKIMSVKRCHVLQGGRCVNLEGSFQCVCEAGYRPTVERGACTDVDECAEQRVCRNGRCHNTAGSFRCECLPGFTLSADGRTCLGMS